MELWQILSIVLGTVFIILFVAWIVSTVLIRRNDKKRMEIIEKMYADVNFLTMDYHSAANVEEELLLAHARRSGQASFNNGAQLTVYGISESENLEEITGNYNP